VKVAHDLLGDNAVAITATSPTYPNRNSVKLSGSPTILAHGRSSLTPMNSRYRVMRKIPGIAATTARRSCSAYVRRRPPNWGLPISATARTATISEITVRGAGPPESWRCAARSWRQASPRMMCAASAANSVSRPGRNSHMPVLPAVSPMGSRLPPNGSGCRAVRRVPQVDWFPLLSGEVSRRDGQD